MAKVDENFKKATAYLYGVPDFESLPMEEPLPDWAKAKAKGNGAIKRMQQLCTKDGRRVGNATVFDISLSHYGGKLSQKLLFSVVTDAGSIMHLNFIELNDLFWVGEWIMRKYPNQKCYDAIDDYVNGD